MSDYRRAYQPGGHHFFTLVTHNRVKRFSDPQEVDRLRAAFRPVKAQHPFSIEAIVILPDHLHALWTLPTDDDDFSLRWRLIKHKFSVGVEAPVNHRGEQPIWQRRYWEHLIRDPEDWERHMDYIHYNPVKHGYVGRPRDWPYSSFARCVERGWYSGRVEPLRLFHPTGLERAQRRMAMRRPDPRVLGQVLLGGQAVPVQVVRLDSWLAPNRVAIQDGELQVTIGPRSRTSPARSLENWLRKRAREQIAQHVSELGQRVKRTPGKVYIMDQRTKWGNCSGLAISRSTGAW